MAHESEGNCVVDRPIKEGFTYVVDTAHKSCFNTIPHEQLMRRVVLALIRSFFNQDIMHGLDRWTPTAGTRQGAVISPLLANIYLHPLDELMLRQMSKCREPASPL